MNVYTWFKVDLTKYYSGKHTMKCVESDVCRLQSLGVRTKRFLFQKFSKLLCWKA